MAQLTAAQEADLNDLHSIILDESDFDALMKDEKQVEDILNRPYLVETMEAAILDYDKRIAEAEETETPRLLSAFREKRAKANGQNFGQRMAAIRQAKASGKPKRKAKATARKTTKTVEYSADYVLNSDREFGPFRKGKEGAKSNMPIGIETYKSENGGPPILINRRMYSLWQLRSILVTMPADRAERLREIVNAS